VDDTYPRTHAMLDAMMRTLAPRQKVKIILDLNRMMDDVALVGIRERDPGCTEHQARVRLAALKYGKELVAKAYGRHALTGVET